MTGATKAVICLSVLWTTWLTAGCSDHVPSRAAEPGNQLSGSVKSVLLSIGKDGQVESIAVNGKTVPKDSHLQKFRYDLVIGAKGDENQLLLNSVYYIPPRLQKIPYAYYELLKKDRMVESAVPLVLGKFTQKGNLPVVGTTAEFFFGFAIRGEHPFSILRSAVIGSEVAKENEWDIGTKFKLNDNGVSAHVHEESFQVTGVLKKSNTPNDSAVFVSLESLYSISESRRPNSEMRKQMDGFFGKTHSDAEWQALSEGKHGLREVSAIHLKGRHITVLPGLSARINERYSTMALNPVAVARRPHFRILRVLHGQAARP